MNGPNSWRNTQAHYSSFWGYADVRPILVNGMFVCGFHCSNLDEHHFVLVEEHYLDNVLGAPTRFSYEDLKNITKNFSNKLGEGGFSLRVHGQRIAGSLDLQQKPGTSLGWQIRKKIILDIARGLAYLYEGCNQKIIHLDIKPQNILLDENFNAKVSDFGLSKILGKEQRRVITTMRGTPSYMVPEWLSSVITEKEEEDRHLLGHFRTKQEEGKLMDLVDKCSDDMQSNSAEVVEMMKVAAWCLQAEYARRPPMSNLVKFFEGSVDVEGDDHGLHADVDMGCNLYAIRYVPEL
ncbi:Signal peptide peptidase isoform 1 [Hibiscus syriacus]|uniref:non-specific serine/threonine protein kinase n=1 Tax=Hibiscus syriacus TaxID=106335 RepID=A0A6A3BUG2_HIBSY|nr:Signal peptide peptidase isoform 1 [Hibiscus syriacus]